ncbi:MAG: hypothetical protein WCR19_02100 [Acholeplasmataceae bacterium]
MNKRKDIQNMGKYNIFNDFYDFLVEDTILSGINQAEYFTLLEQLVVADKSISESTKTTNKQAELLEYFTQIYYLYKQQYFMKLYDTIIDQIMNDKQDFLLIRKYSNIFFNELLNNRVSYKYMMDIVTSFKEQAFKNIYEFLNYVCYEKNENIEILIPIKDYTKIDLAFLDSKEQEYVESIDKNKRTMYLKVFSGGIDYYSIYEINTIRINAYLNFHKFYNNSQIKYNYDEELIIKRLNILKNEIRIPHQEFLKYDYYIGKKEIVESSSKTMNVLYEQNHDLFYKLSNILNYAERDNDQVSVSSFVDNWIALESLIKVSGNYTGYQGVIYYVPQTLATVFFRRYISNLLKYARTDIDEYIYFTDEQKNKLVKNAKSPLKKIEIEELNEIFFNNQLFMKKLNEVEDQIRKDLMRIYILRNEYVHSSNLSVNKNIFPYKLKRIIAEFYDIYMKILNVHIMHINNNHVNIKGSSIYVDIERKNQNKKTAMRLIANQLKINGNLYTKKKIISDTSIHEIKKNILYDRINIMEFSSKTSNNEMD